MGEDNDIKNSTDITANLIFKTSRSGNEEGEKSIGLQEMPTTGRNRRQGNTREIVQETDLMKVRLTYLAGDKMPKQILSVLSDTELGFEDFRINSKIYLQSRELQKRMWRMPRKRPGFQNELFIWQIGTDS